MLGQSEIRKGKIIIYEDQPYVVASAQFSRQQQRRPVVRAVLRNLKTGATREHSFQQSDQVVEADIDHRTAQFLYSQEASYTFMDQTSYEQFEIDQHSVGPAARFLTEGQEVQIVTFEGQPVSVELPIKVDRKVISAPPGVRGDTSTNVTKEVVIEGGAIIKAPLFVNEGDMIRIDTRDGSYVERA